MKKRILALLMAVCMIVSLLPTTVFAADEAAGPAKFTIKGLAEPIVINEGDPAVYLTTDGTNAALGTSGNYQIMVSYETGKNPTLTLNGATLSGKDPITIGDASAPAYNDVAVDIVVTADTTFTHVDKWAAPGQIRSYIAKTLTITSEKKANSDALAKLTLACLMYSSKTGAIHAEQDILLKNANVEMKCSTAWNGSYSSYIISTNGGITVDGGKLSIDTTNSHPSEGARPVFLTNNKDVVFQNGADVTVKMVYGKAISHQVFSLGTGKPVFDNANVTITAANSGTVFGANAPEIKGYDVGYTAKVDGTSYDQTTLPDALASSYTTCKAFSVKPVEPPKMQFAFAVTQKAMSEPYEISEGGDPIYLKTVNVSGNVWAATEGTAGDYQIMITYPKGGKPTLTLNGPTFALGDPNSISAIEIGSTDAGAQMNDLDVDIEVIANSTFRHFTGYGGTFIKSHINGDLTINGNSKSLSFVHRVYQAAVAGLINAVGNVKIVNANVSMGTDWSTAEGRVNYVNTTKGNITISGGSFTASTKAYESGAGLAILNAPAGEVVIENGATVTLTAANQAAGINAAKGTTIKDSTVTITTTHGTLYNAEPTLSYDYKYDLVKAEGSYSVKPIERPKMTFTFADGVRTANFVVTINEGDVPVCLKTIKIVGEKGAVAYGVTEEGAAEDPDIIVSFPEGGKPTLTLVKGKIQNGEGGYSIVVGDAAGDAAINALDVDIVMAGDFLLYHEFNWAVPNLKSYIAGDLTITGEGTLTVSNWSHGDAAYSAIAAVGNVILDDANVVMSYRTNSAHHTDFITSTKGDITVSGGKLTISTHWGSDTSRAALKAPNGKVTIENGAVVNITVNSNATGITAGKGIFIKDSEVTIKAPNGTLFNAEPDLNGFTKEYTKTNENGVYTVTMACQHNGETEVKVENKVDATCTTPGSYDNVTYCKKCGEKLNTETVPVTTIPHTAGTPVQENVVGATCKAEGSYDEVTKCSVCGFEMSRVKKTIDKLPHTNATKTELITAPTCDADGSHYEITYCSVCGDELDRKEVTDAATGDHVAGTPVQENVVGATCKAEGSYDEVTKCSVCGHEMSRVKKTIDKLPHTAGTAVEENKVDATCTADGSYDEVVYCSVCGFEMSRTPKTIDALGHTAGTPVVENASDATCGAAGSYDNVTYCTVCGEELDRETITTDTLPHTDGEVKRENYVPATLNSDGSYDEVVYCAGCGVELRRNTVTIPAKTGAAAKVGDVLYATLAEAIEKANGAEIEVLGSYAGEALIITADTTINFYAYNYTVNTPVNTPVEKTMAAVTIAEGVTLTLKGTGKLVTRAANKADFATLILNNGTLVVEGITLAGTYLAHPEAEAYYTVENVGNNAVATITSGAVTGAPVKVVGTVTRGDENVSIVIPADACWNGNTLVVHNYVGVETKATCTAEGYTTYTCSYCNTSYVGDKVAAQGHSWTPADLNNAKTCSVCGIVEGEPLTGAVATVKHADGSVTNYASLAEAVENAVDGDKITLLKNSVGAGLVINVAGDNGIEINFNDCYYSANEAVDGAVMEIAAGTKVNLSGTGKLVNMTAKKADFHTLILNNGELTVNGVTLAGIYLSATDAEDYYTIKNVGENAKTTIVSGTVTGHPINAGKFFKAADLEIATPDGYSWLGDTELHKCDYSVTNIVGATETTRGYVEHICEKCGDVIESDYFAYSRCVATANGFYFRTLQEAIDYAAANNIEQVDLIGSATGATLVIKSDVTINFNDRYYSANATENGAVMMIAEDANVTLTGTGKLVNMAKVSGQFDTLILNEGNLVIDGITLTGTYLDKADVCYIVAGSGTVEFRSGNVVKNNAGATNGIPGVA